MTLEFRKYNLIKLILNLNNESIVSRLEKVINEEKTNELKLMGLVKPMRKKLDTEILAKEQNYKPPTKLEF